jgi:hypothetical protein
MAYRTEIIHGKRDLAGGPKLSRQGCHTAARGRRIGPRIHARAGPNEGKRKDRCQTIKDHEPGRPAI